MKVWSTQKADNEFSHYIINRDKACLVCGTREHLQNSHFWSKNHSSTRFDPLNCDCLCFAHHYGNAKGWEFEKQGKYRDFKLRQLGKKKYKELEKKAHTYMSRRDAIKQVMIFLNAKH